MATFNGTAGNDGVNGTPANDIFNDGNVTFSGDTITSARGFDTISSGGGFDTLLGGTGNDSLNGGTGLDTFVFNTALSATANVDRLAGFVSAGDTIRLENAVFPNLTTTGTLASTAFVRGTAALDAGDRIVYNSATGQIWHDSDGTGATAKILFATGAAGTAISNTDFVVVRGSTSARHHARFA